MYANEWLEKAVSTALRGPTRPGYYSGRGATFADLNSDALEQIFVAIRTAVNEDAAEAFARMVADIQVLSATDLLITLQQLEHAQWVWSKDLLPTTKGVHADNMDEAFGTVLTMLGGGAQRDETVSIRHQFLRDHGITDPRGGLQYFDPYHERDLWAYERAKAKR